MDNLLGSMSWNEEERATLIRKKEKPTHDGGWELNFTSIPASPASLLVGSDRPWTLPVKLLDTWGVLDWHSKRGIIQRLYFTEDKTLGEIMRVMKIEHSFDASKSQYKRQFKKWNFRKNLTRNEWPIVQRKMPERATKRNKVREHLNNKLISDETIKKDASRHSSLPYSSFPYPRTAIPLGLAFRTPSPVFSKKIRVLVGGEQEHEHEYEPEKVLEITTDTDLEELNIPQDMSFKAHDQAVTAVSVNLSSSLSGDAPNTSALVPQATISKTENPTEALYREYLENRPIFRWKPNLLMSTNSELPPFREPNRAQDGLNKWATKHIPSIGINSLPSTSIPQAKTALCGFSDVLAWASIAKGPSIGTASGTQTPSNNQVEMGLENAAAAIEWWVQRLAIKAPGTLKGRERIEAPDLVELLDEAGSSSRYENVENIDLPEIIPQPDHPQIRGFSKRDWADLKPIIRNLCLDQGQTLEQLAKYLEDNHGYKPTKKQLIYRIFGWGFEKNVKKDKRREFIQKLSHEIQNPHFLPQNLRGRITHNEKLNRWMRLENMEVGPSVVGNEGVLEDEDSDAEMDFAKPKWTQSPALRRTLFEQETIGLEDLFGQPEPLNMEELFSKSKDRSHKFRERLSSRSDVEVETPLLAQPASNADCNEDPDMDCHQRKFQNSPEATITNDMIDDMTGSMDGEESTTESYSSESETGSNNSAYLDLCKAEHDGHSLPKIIEPVLDPMRQALVDRIMEEFWVLFDQEWDTGFVKGAAGVSPPLGSGSSSGITTSANSMSLPPIQRKRQREEEDSPEKRNGRNSRQPRNSVGSSTGCNDSTRFACHFRKHDSRKYSVYSHRVCALSHWETIARVKEHLYRCHQRPVHCKRCWKIFKIQEQLDSHLTVLDADICGLQAGCSPEGITPEHERRLRSRKKTSPDQTDEDRWKDIYRLLFPNEEIPSPYFETLQEETPMSPDSRDLADYEAYIRAELPRLVRFNIEEVVRRDMQPLEASLIGSLVGIIRDCQDRVFRSYRETQRRRDELGMPATITREVSAALESIKSADNDLHDLHTNPLDQHLRPSPFVGDVFQQPPVQNVDSGFQMPARGEVQGGFLGPSSDLMNSDSGYTSEQVQFCDCPGPCNCVGTSSIPRDLSQDASNNFNPQGLGCGNMLGNGWGSTQSRTELNSMGNDFDWMNDI